MSQTKYPLPKDLKMQCISIVRGYERMVQKYKKMQEEIAYQSPEPPDGQPKGNGIGDSCFQKATKLMELENEMFVIQMRAVEQAKLHIGDDIANPDEREKVVDAVWDSCTEGRNFIYEYRALCVSKSNFYERRRKFLYDIAKNLNFL